MIAAMLIVDVAVALKLLSETVVTKERDPLTFVPGAEVIFPAVAKYVFNAATEPWNVLEVAVPPTVILSPATVLPVIVPSLTAKVTVKFVVSGSANGVDGA